MASGWNKTLGASFVVGSLVGLWALPDPLWAAVPERTEKNWMDQVDQWFGDYLVAPLEKVIFFDFGTSHWLGTRVPFVVIWLIFGAVFFTLLTRFLNFRAFWHGICLTRGDYDDPEETGEVSHFQALSSALSATVGMGNIAGVAIAVTTGGPGATFWMILAGLFGMTSKFAECTLGLMYRKIAPDGTVSGGPMHYLRQGLAELGLSRLGVVLSLMFTVCCIGGSMAGGCAFQVRQSLGLIRQQVPFLQGREWIYGLVLVFLVGIVIVGGIRRIAATAEKIVPAMCGIYVAAALYIVAVHPDKILSAIIEIFRGAFQPEAAYGSVLGVMVIGITRAAFSNEAGIGSASIAHSAAKTEEPVSEGIVALLEPFIDTVVVCTMTALVIIVTDVHNDPECTSLIRARDGAALTAEAFRTVLPWFPMVLAVAVFLFAYSTMISWSYYGERCWTTLFGQDASLIYKIIFLAFVFLGSIVTAQNVLTFGDLMILSMAFPNMLGLLCLRGKIMDALDAYWTKYKTGQLEAKRRRS